MKTTQIRFAFFLQFVFVAFFALRLYAPIVGYFPQPYVVGLTLSCIQYDEFGDLSVSNAFSLFGNPPNGVSVFKIKPEGFIADNYLGEWTDPNLPLPVGEAWFLRNPLTQFTNTFAGNVVDGTNKLSAGWNACGSILAQGGPLSSTLGCPVAVNDVVYIFNPTNQAYASFTYTNADGWDPSEPSVAEAQGFWIQKSSPVDWTQSVVGSPTSHLSMTITSTVGQVNFFTYNPSNSAYGQVFNPGGSVPVSTNYFGQLYAGPTNQESSLAAIGAPVRFLGGTFAGYIRSSTVYVPGTLGSNTVYLQLRAWEGSSASTFEAASASGAARGKSAIFSAQTGATIVNNLPGLPPERTDGFPSFSVQALPPETLIITSITLSNGIPRLSYLGVAGQTYVTETATNLASPVWTPVSTNVANVGGTFQAIDSISPATSQRFYRGRSAN